MTIGSGAADGLAPPIFDSPFRFHGIVDNPYPLPNDEMEKERLDGVQLMFHTMLGANIVVPIKPNPRQIGSHV